MPQLILQLILAAAQDIKDDDMHVSAAPAMGLCNTTELMDMLDGYYKADLNDNSMRIAVVSTLAWIAMTLLWTWTSKANAQQALPNIDLGTSSERFDFTMC